MSINFEWDDLKAESNLRKHGVSFEEAATAFGDPLSITAADPDHSEQEDRFILVGSTFRDRLVVVVHSERGDRIRIIGARPATRSERRAYEQV